ncbi:DUF1707 SHOCT-like domain-containing protein [Williamsia sp. MIQD14]|uniref:DUF1707 SHOCT-like domain-containing protein n=1 Tax=Williamsia sp. MIQD14 TaxID=3425703 RepID=UPI003DA0D0F6
MVGQPDDAIRVGNPERERAITHLNDAFATGYIDIGEFEERSGRVYEARTRGDLRSVLENLPIAARLFPDTAVAAATGAPPVPTRPVEFDANWETVRRKGVWDAPPNILVTGTMGTVDLDFTNAMIPSATVTVQLQVSAMTVKLRVGPDQEIRRTGLTTSGMSSVKDKAGAPTRPGGAVIDVIGSISAMTGLTIRRTGA